MGLGGYLFYALFHKKSRNRYGIGKWGIQALFVLHRCFEETPGLEALSFFNKNNKFK